MAIKYIQKKKDGNWGISNSKTGKTIRNAKTEKEALAITGTYKNVEGVMILRKGTWKQATGWDMELVNVTKTPKKAVAKKKTTSSSKGITKRAPVKKNPAKTEVIITTTTRTKTQNLSGKTPATKKNPAKIMAKNKTKEKLVVIDNRKNKNAVIKKAPTRKTNKKTTINSTKTTTVTSSKDRKEKVGLTGDLPGWAGLIIGLSIIIIVIGAAFLIGYYI